MILFIQDIQDIQEDNEYVADEDKQEEEPTELIIESEEVLLGVDEINESNNTDRKKLKKSKVNIKEEPTQDVCIEEL